MKRRHIHLAFALTALGFGCLAVYQGWQLQQSNRINEAIASASVAALDNSIPDAQFARALAMSKSGDYEAALKTYKALIQGDRADLRLAALHNLGNLHMREALKSGTDNVAKSLPFIELAKQSYRDLLRDDPDDWDARYNLERALWLAPEVEDQSVQTDSSPIKERRVITGIVDFTIELP
jgi:mxaK protein